jgi:hypothetical protein
MIPRTISPPNLMAPCGMNCSVCMAYLRKKNRCNGCNIESPEKANHCARCLIKNCGERPKGSAFCFSCGSYPCLRLRKLDKRYRLKYHMSMIENLNRIRILGLSAFIVTESNRWACPECGNSICVHNGKCYHCNFAAREK